MRYCVHCACLTEEAACPLCGREDLRAPEDGDFCFLTERQAQENEREAELLSSLLAVRKRLSKEKKIRQDRIFRDNELRDMVKLLPRSKADLLFVEGVSPVRALRYGGEFLAEIRIHNALYHKSAL